jgi:hypothetical protein
MEEKDTLHNMFMDMGKANEWARQVMSPDGKGLEYWTSQIDNFTTKIEEETNEFGWAEELNFVTLYEFLGNKSAGKELGKIVYNASIVMGVKSKKKAVGAGQDGIKTGMRAYPEAWLEMWFRDYDAKLSMEVYNKAKAKEALNELNKR